MDEIGLNEIEVASLSVVHAAERDFAAALAETAQFKAFEQTYEALSHDTTAQQALSAYRDKVESLNVLLQLNAASENERAELERLRQDYLTRATVQSYAAAQADLTTLCQQAAGMISAAIGLNYAASCGASCCG
ncbi:MAG: YlbF family regulator [Chloroflexi bacterium]|nr:YlbF family regulator [Chloroflexota bacterium]